MTAMLCEPGVQERTWTKAEYYRLGELGFFRGQRVELIDGRLMVHSPPSPAHADTVDGVDDALSSLFPTGFLVRCLLPVDLGQIIEPEPDVAVVIGRLRQYQRAHPTSAELIPKVSESTLAYDRLDKGSLYARAGIADYWIVNLVDLQVEVYRDPIPDSTQPHGWRYATRTDLTPPAMLVPLALATPVAVQELLP
jgi:Uma2 family endonuclease